MTDLREKRIAILTRWHRDLSDDFLKALPRVLDDLEAADAEHSLSDPCELAEDEAEALAREMERTRQAAAGLAQPSAAPAKPVKPQPRRRPARKAAS